jgi:ADP-heptose:LPS heptosyltransferase
MLRDIFYNYFTDILGSLYFHLGINLVPEKKHPIDVGGVKKVCIFATEGIGNLTVLTPMIQSLRRGIPEVSITVVVSSDEMRDTIEDSDLVVVLDSKRKLKKIRDDWPDLAIDATHRGYAGAKMAFRSGAMYRLGFRYDKADKMNTGFMYTHAVPLDESKEEAERRLDLIRPLELR